MDLYRINLNLLVALDVLLEERSVTNAAKKLYISQSAMSDNLQQLRHILKDELLQRKKNQMVLTHYAGALRPRLRTVIAEIRNIVKREQQFNLAACDRTFKIGLVDYWAELVFPQLIAVMEREAPNMQINTIPLSQMYSEELFVKEQIHIGIGRASILPKPIRSHLLVLDDATGCMMSKHHPLAKKKTITVKDFLSFPHIAFRTQNPYFSSVIDEALVAAGYSPRKTMLHLPCVDAVLAVLEKSNQLLTSLTRTAEKLAQNRHHCVAKKISFLKKIPSNFYIAWHEQFENDTAHRWLRNQIIRIVEDLKKKKKLI